MGVDGRSLQACSRQKQRLPSGPGEDSSLQLGHLSSLGQSRVGTCPPLQTPPRSWLPTASPITAQPPPTLLQTLGNRRCPNFTSHLLESCQPSPQDSPCRPVPYFPHERCREGAGVPWPSPREFTPTSPAIVIQLLGYGTVETQISGLASRLRNLSPGSPPIIGTQIGRHCEQIAGIKGEAVSGASWGHSSARAMHYLL